MDHREIAEKFCTYIDQRIAGFASFEDAMYKMNPEQIRVRILTGMWLEDHPDDGKVFDGPFEGVTFVKTPRNPEEIAEDWERMNRG